MLIETLERRGITLNLDPSGNLKVESPDPLTDEQRGYLKLHKVELIAELESVSAGDLHEAREERAAILEYDQGFTREQAEKEAARRIHFVTCGSCMRWEGNSPCGAGMNTSGDPIPGIAVRLCGFHTEKAS